MNRLNQILVVLLVLQLVVAAVILVSLDWRRIRSRNRLSGRR
ncbi:MAG: hypothetical protein P8189_27050 [Anaerolineae bacterium]